jgi:hypothetical protein
MSKVSIKRGDLGHRVVYLGSRQRIAHAVNDKLGPEPDASSAEQLTEFQILQATTEDHFRTAGKNRNN